MAEGSRDQGGQGGQGSQGGVGTTDPEEDSPNMIVYRKVSLTPLYVCAMLSGLYDGRNTRWEPMTRRQAPDSPLVRISVDVPHAGFTVSLRCQEASLSSQLLLSPSLPPVPPSLTPTTSPANFSPPMF